MSPVELDTFLRRSSLRAQAASALESHATLAVDTQHPFFFDHPLDHLPGLLLVTAMVQLAWHCASQAAPLRARALYNARLAARFTKWCVFEPDVHLHARGRDALPAIVDVTARQGGAQRCESQVRLEPMHATLAPCDTPRAVAPCEQRLVNKHAVENVMIGTPDVSPERLRTSVLTPPPRHALAGPDVQALGTVYLLEAFMQTQRWLNKTAEQASGVRLRDTLCEVSIELHRPIARCEPVDIVRPLAAVTAGRGRRRHDGELRVRDETVGRCAIVTLGYA